MFEYQQAATDVQVTVAPVPVFDLLPQTNKAERPTEDEKNAAPSFILMEPVRQRCRGPWQKESRTRLNFSCHAT